MAPRRTWHRKKRKRKEKKEAEEKKKSEPQADPSMQNTAYNNHADNGSLQILAPTSFGAYNDIHPTAGDNSTVIGYLETKINYSSCIADDAIRYAAFVETVDVRIEGIATQIRVTSSIFGDIKRIFGEFIKDGKYLGSEPLLKIQDLYDDIQQCSIVFRNIVDDIYGIVRDLPSPSEGRLTRKRMSLKAVARAHLEARIQNAGGMIHVYQWRLSIQFQTFSMRLSNQNTVEIRDMLANLIWGRSSDGQVSSVPQGQPFFNAHGPVHFGFHPHYTGWEIKYAVKSAAHNWIVPNIPLPFSNEDLFLQAVGMRADYVKRGQTLQELYDDMKDPPRQAVDRLIYQQNRAFQQANAPLEWKLAGLEPRIRLVKDSDQKIKYLFVILKTEWKLPPGKPRNKSPGPAGRSDREENTPEAPRPRAQDGNTYENNHTRNNYEQPSTSGHENSPTPIAQNPIIIGDGPSRVRTPPPQQAEIPVVIDNPLMAADPAVFAGYSGTDGLLDEELRPLEMQETRETRYYSSPSPEHHRARENVEDIYQEWHQDRVRMRYERPPPPPLHLNREIPHIYDRPPPPQVNREIPHIYARPPPPQVNREMPHIYARPPPPQTNQRRPRIHARPPPPEIRRREYEEVRTQIARDPIRRNPEYVHLWKDQDRRHWEDVYLGRVQRSDLTVEDQDMVIDGLVSQWDEVVERPPNVNKTKITSTSTWRKTSKKTSKGFVFVKHGLTRAKVERVDP